jgi:hypothetical protein
MGIFDIATDMRDGYNEYAPVSSLTFFVTYPCHFKQPGLFTPVLSIGEARRVFVSPLHIAIQGLTFNAILVLEQVADFLRYELDAITELRPIDVIVRQYDSAYLAIQIAVSVLQAVIDTLLSAVTIVTRAAATVMFGLAVVGFGLYDCLSSCNSAKTEKTNSEKSPSVDDQQLENYAHLVPNK